MTIIRDQTKKLSFLVLDSALSYLEAAPSREKNKLVNYNHTTTSG